MKGGRTSVRLRSMANNRDPRNCSAWFPNRPSVRRERSS